MGEEKVQVVDNKEEIVSIINEKIKGKKLVFTDYYYVKESD